MKLVLILMIRNEERILKRCLEAVESIVDAFAICDTGSTDKTCEIADEFLKTRKGCLSKTEWKNFGHNRTLSFAAAQHYVKEKLKWNLEETYGLLLDADMVFVPRSLRQQTLKDIGYTIIQRGGNIEYPNCRLVRMDYNWTCRGVTHEYWDGPTSALDRDVCYIDDRNDGGCKSDKFERDVQLLEKGLQDEPDNVRYMFYLAQTYHSLGRWKDCIAMYKKRIAAGGWEEEVWYSHYMIGQSYKSLDNIPKFEEWMLRAHARRPGRAESLYQLAKHFRETSQHHKAYAYVRMGLKIPMSKDSLFIEKDVYTHLFKYEATICDFYVFDDKSIGLRDTTHYLLDRADTGVLANMQFYVQPIGKGERLSLPRDLFGSDCHPGSVCVYPYKGKVFANLRYVNYRLNPEDRNTYEMCEKGVYSTSHTVRTQNAWWDFSDSRHITMRDDTVSLPRKESHICGLEDVRVFPKKDGLYFTATALEYSPKIRIVYGKYLPETGSYADCCVLESPNGTEVPCEKNWLGVPYTDDVIYGWNPLRVGKIEDSKWVEHTSRPTPAFFEWVRGSAPPFRINDELWCLVHVVEYSRPRKYYHLFVVLEAGSYAPLRMSMPFVFGSPTVEYCLGACWTPDGILCVYSTMDDNPARVVIQPKDLKWVDL